MNIAVINIKDIIKYIFCMVFIFVIILVVMNLINDKEELEGTLEEETSFVNDLQNSSFLYCLKKELAIFSVQEDKTENESIKDKFKMILTQEIAILGEIDYEDLEESIDYDEVENIEVAETETETEDEQTETKTTEVIEENNITASYTNDENNVKINNQTTFDINDIITNSSYELTNKNKVIIYHTHTCESYTASESYNYEMTGSYRTTDLNYTVARVGDELATYLENYQKTVIHDKTYHDYPSYNGSYGRSLTTLTNILEENNDGEIAIDLHRDAVGSSESYAPTVKIGDELCAQLMFVIGTDGSRFISPKLERKSSFCCKSSKDSRGTISGVIQTDNIEKC